MHLDNLKHLLSKTLDETTVLLHGWCLNSLTLRTRNLQHDILLTVCIDSYFSPKNIIASLNFFFLICFAPLHIVVFNCELIAFLLTFLSTCNSSLPWRISTSTSVILLLLFLLNSSLYFNYDRINYFNHGINFTTFGRT